MKIAPLFTSFLLCYKQIQIQASDSYPLVPSSSSRSLGLKTLKKRLRSFLRCDPDGPNQINPSQSIQCEDLPSINSTWSQVGSDIDGTFEDGLSGLSVSLSGDGLRLAISSNGGLKIYTPFMLLTSGTVDWTLNGNLGSYLEEYVVSVAISTDGLNLIAGEQETLNTKQGEQHLAPVYVFKYVNDTVFWVQSGNTVYGSHEDGFGRAVDISDDGDIIAIGAPEGLYVSVYGLEGLTWELTFNQIEGNFGKSLALSSDGKMIAMGSPDNDSAPGSVHVYEIGSNDLITKIHGDSNEDRFGYSVALANEGTRLVVGAPGGDYVKVFNYDSFASNFTELPFTLQSSANNTLFGRSVAVSGDGIKVGVGAPGFNSDTGKAFVYLVNNCGSEYRLESTFAGESALDTFGYSIDLSTDGTYFAVGGIANEGIFGSISGNFDAGHVRVFQRDDDV